MEQWYIDKTDLLYCYINITILFNDTKMRVFQNYPQYNSDKKIKMLLRELNSFETDTEHCREQESSELS